jgi:hypothetical protein
MATEDDEQEIRAKHRGHELLVTASRSGERRWFWSYLVDGRVHGRGRVACTSAEMALRMGLSAAKVRADGL